MKIYRPTESDKFTQKFGENKACSLLGPDGKLALPYKTIGMPSSGKCPSGYASLYEFLGMDGHAGEDFAGNKGEPIYFDILADGIEWEAQPVYSATTGHGVLIRSKQPIPLDKCPEMPGASLNLAQRQYDTNGGAVHLMRYYGHFDQPSHLKSRQAVKFGDKVGLMGMSGLSSGVHTHRHLLVCGPNEQNPFFYLDGDSNYRGRIDESEWFENESAHQIRVLLDKKVALQKQVIELLKALVRQLKLKLFGGD